MGFISHDLGFGHGSLIEDSKDGTVAYRSTGKILPAFTVRLVDVASVSGQALGSSHVLMQVHGRAGVLAEIQVNNGTTERVAEWFKARIGSAGFRAGTTAPVAARSLSEELEKLAGLYNQGILSADEFAAAKRKLIGYN